MYKVRNFIQLRANTLKIKKKKQSNSQYILFRRGSRNFKTGGRGPGAIEFFDLRFALMPLYTYPMFVLEE